MHVVTCHTITVHGHTLYVVILSTKPTGWYSVIIVLVLDSEMVSCTLFVLMPLLAAVLLTATRAQIPTTSSSSTVAPPATGTDSCPSGSPVTLNNVEVLRALIRSEVESQVEDKVARRLPAAVEAEVCQRLESTPGKQWKLAKLWCVQHCDYSSVVLVNQN